MPPEDFKNLPLAGEENFPFDSGFPSFDLLDPLFLARLGWPALMPPPHPMGQGRQPSCTAWAVGYAAATGTLRFSGTQLANPISPADLFAKILRRTPNACTSGSMISYAMDTLVQEGVTTLDNAPYSDLQCGIPSNALAYNLDGFSRVSATDTVAIQGSIQMMQPVSFGILVDERFQALDRQNAVYSPNGGGSGHAMTIVGYENKTQRYKIMNSWGTDWGDAGNFWISYSDFARFASDVCIPYLRNTKDNALSAESTSNSAIPIRVQHMKTRKFGAGAAGTYGVGIELGWSQPLDIRGAAVAIFDDAQKTVFSQSFTVRQIARGIRFGTRIADEAAIYSLIGASVSGSDSSGSPVTLIGYSKAYSR